MLIVKHLMPVGATVEDAKRVMSQPGVAESLANLKTAKSATKTRMKSTWGPEIAEIFLPTSQRPGRPKVVVEEKSLWSPLSKAVLTAIADKLEVDLPLPEDAEFWTKEAASLASDVIHEQYKNPHTATTNAYKLRLILKGLGVADDGINATKRAEVTTAHNAINLVRREERQEVGIEIPAQYKNIADLKARAETFVTQPNTARPSSLDAADFLVIWSARPGEAQTLYPGPTGGVIGALKKRNIEPEEYPVASALDTELALSFLSSWRARSENAIKAAMNGLNARVKTWGITRPDLRAIGAELAVRAAKENGRIANAGQETSVREMALRHGAPQEIKEPDPVCAVVEEEAPPIEEPIEAKAEKKAARTQVRARKAAVDHYTRVNDPSIAVCAKLANASPQMLAAVSALLSASEEDQTMICALITKMRLEG